MNLLVVLGRSIIVILMICATFGCATGPVFEKPEAAPEGSAQVYVYRVLRPVGAIPYLASIDESTELINLPNGSWQRLVLPPGNHSISVKDYFGVSYCGPRPLNMQLRSGETAYVRQEVYVVSFVMNVTTLGCSLKQPPEESALAEMSNLRRAQ